LREKHTVFAVEGRRGVRVTKIDEVIDTGLEGLIDAGFKSSEQHTRVRPTVAARMSGEIRARAMSVINMA
jgi:hypothetical protein